jgi:hypothetical protein
VVLAPASDRVRVATAAASALLDAGAHVVLTTVARICTNRPQFAWSRMRCELDRREGPDGGSWHGR